MNKIKLLGIALGLVSFAAAPPPLAHAQKWVPLTSFKDKTFQTYLSTAYKSSLSTDKTQINVLNITSVNLSSETYKAIVTLDGIKELVNLKYLYLPGKGTSKRDFSLKSVDVSEMTQLEIIDNGSYVSCKTSTDPNGFIEATSSSSGGTGIGSIELEELVAENCPKLRYVAAGGSKYANLKTVRLEGSTNLEALYLGSTAITSLDVSGFPKLENKLKTSGTTGGYTTSSANKIPNFALASCQKLTELTLGEHTGWEALALTSCPEIETLDICGLTGLVHFAYKSYSSSSATSGIMRGAGKLSEIVFAEEYPSMQTFYLYQHSMRSLDTSSFEKNVTSFVARSGYLRKLDVTRFTKATAIDVSFNCLYDIALPPNKACKGFYFKYNRAVTMPYPGDTHKSIATTSNGDYHENIRNVGRVMRYKVFDDKKMTDYVMTEDDTQANRKDYYAPQGGHFGKEEDGEDPCYFYFDNEYVTGKYWMYFPNTYATTGTNKGKPSSSVSYALFTMSRNYPDQYDVSDFYLAGDFNNWAPGDEHRFTLTGTFEDGMYELDMPGVSVNGNFRIWNAPLEKDANLNFGGHGSDKYVWGAQFPINDADAHIFFNAEHNYMLGDDRAVHYTTNPNSDWSRQIASPHFYMRYKPESEGVSAADGGNYLKLYSGVITGIDNVATDADADAPAEYYNLQGIRVDIDRADKGVYIRRQGNRAEKVVAGGR